MDFTAHDGNIATRFLGGRVAVVTGDLTQQRVDAIVNAANATLLGGGGVDGAIHDAGGPEILAACRELRRTIYPQGLPTGAAALTTGGKLPARYVIHTVGPIYGRNPGQEESWLAACYRNSMALAVAHGLQTIAFPSISTGAYGYPAHLAAPVVAAALREFLAADATLDEVRLVFFQPREAKTFLKHQKLLSA